MFRRRGPSSPPRHESSRSSTDWSDIRAVQAEWPAADLQGEADLAAWRRGRQIYDDNDDYRSMIEASGLLCRALRHHLYGDGILFGNDLLDTVHRVLFAAVAPPPDGKTLAAAARRELRLALTITKKHRWQPERLGGSGPGDPLFGDRGCFMLYGAAIAPSPDQPWGDLRGFFTNNPIQIAPGSPSSGGASPVLAPLSRGPDREEMDAVVDRTYEALQRAKRGDQGSQHRINGVALALNGDNEGALWEFEAAGQMGDLDAMFDAGCLHKEAGRTGAALYWWETGAAAGHGSSAYNLGAHHAELGDQATAERWWIRAGELGDASAYAALTQIATQRGDAAAEWRWASAGADAGHPFCLIRHSQHLMEASPDDAALLREALALQRRAAEAGDAHGMFMVGLSHYKLDEHTDARLWLQRAAAGGYSQAAVVLDRLGW